jgi:peroxiredoxin
MEVKKIMTLSQRIEEKKEALKEELTTEMIEQLSRGVNKVELMGLNHKCLKEGDRIPEVVLKNRDGKEIRLSEFIQQGPIVINFYRGHWCPFCTEELKMYKHHFSQFSEAGFRIVSISPETPQEIAHTIDSCELPFDVLSDPGNQAARAFGIAFELPEEMKRPYEYLGISLPRHNGDGSWTLPIPATYVAGTDGTIVIAHVDADYTKRAEPEQVLQEIRQLQEKLGVVI